MIDISVEVSDVAHGHLFFYRRIPMSIHYYMIDLILATIERIYTAFYEQFNLKHVKKKSIGLKRSAIARRLKP